MKYLWTTIGSIAGVFLGGLRASQYGVKVADEYLGFMLPYVVALAIVGLIIDFATRKKDGQ